MLMMCLCATKGKIKKKSHNWNFLFHIESRKAFAGLGMAWTILLQNNSNFLFYLLERLLINNYFMQHTKQTIAIYIST